MVKCDGQRLYGQFVARLFETLLQRHGLKEDSVLFSKDHVKGRMNHDVGTLERIKKLYLENFDFEEDRLRPEATIDSLGLDSLDRIEFMFALEKEFDIKIPDREVTLNTIQDMIDVVDRLVLEQPAQREREAP
jgi:acyl carrier protein